MLNSPRSAAPFALVLAVLAACAERGPVLSREEARPSHPDCPGTAVVVVSGVDANGDGTLAEAEIGTTVVVCESAEACVVEESADATTVTCPNHPPVVMSKAPQRLVNVRDATATECPDGGHVVAHGFDDGRDGVLDETEIEETAVLCADAPFPLLSRGDRVEGQASCGGGSAVVLVAGLDADLDGSLAESEVGTTVVVCDSAAACEVEESSDATHVTCPNHPPVVVPRAPERLANVREASVAECAHGGHVVELGLDDVTRDGVLDATEIDSTNALCVDEPYALLSRGEHVEAHATCDGGSAVVVVSGLDADADGALGESEIGATVVVCDSAAACDVEASATATTVTCPNHPPVVVEKDPLPAPKLVAISTAAVPVPCARGGFVVSVGLDDGAGDEGGNAVLDASEIDERTTLCAPWCGDGTVDGTIGETCDDGGTTSFDGCSATCRVEPSCAGTTPPASCFETGFRIETVAPATGPTVGGTVVALTGNFPAPGAGADTIAFGGATLAATHVSNTRVEFVTPAGKGTAELRVTVNDYPIAFVQRSFSASGLVTVALVPTATFTYLRPSITAVSGCVDDVAPTAAGCAPAGGEVLQITGANFGVDPAAVSVSVGGAPCTSVVLDGDGALRCTSPARPSGGFDLDVVVTVAGQSSAPFAAVSYAAPRILPGTLRLAGGAAADALDLAALGSAVVEFEVAGLGSVPEVSFGVGGAEFACAVDPAASHPIVPGHVRCSTAAVAVGRDLRFRVRDGGVSSRLGTDRLSFPAPVIVAESLRARPTALGGAVLTGAASFGDRVFFDVENVTADATHLQVLLGWTGGPYLLECSGITVSGGPLRYTIGCTTPLGAGDGFVFVVRALNNDSIEGTDTFNYPRAPVVSTIQGCVDAPPDTYGCPTEGGVRLRISGTNFELPGLVVTVGGAHCGELELNADELECTLPPGVGSPEVVVSAAGSSWRCADTSCESVPGIVHTYAVVPLNAGVSLDDCTSPPVFDGVDGVGCPTAGGSAGFSVRMSDGSPPLSECEAFAVVLPTAVGCVVSSFPFVTGARRSLSSPTLTYAPPAVTSVSGCTDLGVTTVDCPAAGGVTLTLRGTNFGPSGAMVLVGDRPCAGVTHGNDPHRELTCTLPPGAGANQSIRVFNGFVSAPFHLSYAE